MSGVTQLSALLKPISLVTFLFGDKKVTPPCIEYEKSFCFTQTVGEALWQSKQIIR